MSFLRARSRVMTGSFSGHTTPSPRLMVARPEDPRYSARGVDPFASIAGLAGGGQVEVRRQASAGVDFNTAAACSGTGARKRQRFNRRVRSLAKTC